MVICLERDADLHMAQLMPLLLAVSCFSKIQIGFTFLVPAHPGSPRKRAVKRVCVCVCVCVCAAVDQWCPRRILNIRWHNFVRNADIRRIINQPPFHPSLSPVVSLCLGILHEWMRTQMIAKPSSNLLQRTGGDHRGGRTQLG